MMYRMFLSEIYVIEDTYWCSLDGAKLTGTYTTQNGYISNIQQGAKIDITFPSSFVMTYEFYRPSTVTNRTFLWSIGEDANNCKLVGYNTGDFSNTKDLAIYNRVNGSNSVCQNNSSPDYNNNEWSVAKITCNDGRIVLNVGSTSIECNYQYITNMVQVYSTTRSYLRNIKIKRL